MVSQVNSDKVDILIVDDQSANLTLLTTLLSESGYQVRPAISGQLALTAAQKSPPDLILLDIRMPDIDGYEICKRLKADEKTRDIPIIFISALDETQDKVRALAAGGVDYVTKPFQDAEVLARVETHLALRAAHRQLEHKTAQLEQEIAERIQAETALGEQEARFRAITESITDITAILDQKGVCQYISPSIHQISGYLPDECLGRTLDHLVYSDDLPVVQDSLTHATREPGTTIRVPDFRLIHRDGRWLYLEGAYVNLLDLAGVNGIVFSGRDITERKRVDAELHRLSRAVEQSPSIVTITDTQGNIEYINPKFTRVTGYSSDKVLGKNARLLKSDQQSPEFYEEMWSTILAGKEWRGEFINRKKDGEPYWELASISPIRNVKGEITHFVKVGEDFTARAQAEEVLRQRNQELALLNQVGQELAATLDLQQVIDQLLQAATKTIGAVDASVWLHDEEQDGWLVCRAAFLQGKSHTPVNLRVRSGQGVVGWVAQEEESVVVSSAEDDPRFFSGIDERTGFRTSSLIAVPLRVHGAVIGVLEVLNKQSGDFDVHDLALVETLAASAAIAIDNARLVEALRRQTTKLEEHNVELDAFAHTVAHDLKNPLNLIIGYTEVLKEDCITMSRLDLQSRLRKLAQHGYKMNDIVDELLLLAGIRQIEVELEPLDMTGVVREALERLSLLIEEHQAEIILPDTWPVALGYAPWVEEVLVNYLSNAFKYGGRPPRVELGADQTITRPGAHILAGAEGRTDRSMIRFWVCDNGLGLTAAEQARLFTPFTRLEQVRTKGHGLGLSIVRRIVEKLGGDVGVESQVGHGSMFFFTLAGAPAVD